MVVSLMVDEMSLCHNVHFDGEQFIGGTDFGEIDTGTNPNIAKDALCFMVVGLNEHWKLPVAYFLVAGLNASERANLCKLTAQKLLDIGLKFTSLTCDGPKVHLSMLKLLGANLDTDNLETQIFQDLDSPPIYLMLDMCHDVKNVRNAWKHHRVFKNAKGERIDWSFLEKLVHLQESEHLQCANKLTTYHINFENQKMKVKLATQLFSRSVAKSLEFCREHLKLKDFEDSKATQEFIQNMNDIFDLMNSRTKFGPSISGALRTDNYNVWKPFLDMIEEYLLGLENLEGVSMVQKDGRKTGFLGIICNIHAVQNIFHTHVQNGDLEYICTYKLSQDHLEHFFGLIRARFGAHNNPTPYQFKKTFRRILLGVTDSIVENANVILQDNTEIVGLIPSVQGKMDYMSKFYDLEDIEVEKIRNLSQSDYTKNVVNYISGFVIKKIIPKISCNECIELLKSEPYDGLTRHRDFENYMYYPSNFVTRVTSLCEKVLQPELDSKNWLSKKYYFDYMLVKVTNAYVCLHGNELVNMHGHSFEMIKRIISMYTCIRLKHFAREENRRLKKNKLRAKLSKIVLFNGQ